MARSEPTITNVETILCREVACVIGVTTAFLLDLVETVYLITVGGSSFDCLSRDLVNWYNDVCTLDQPLYFEIVAFRLLCGIVGFGTCGFSSQENCL